MALFLPSFSQNANIYSKTLENSKFVHQLQNPSHRSLKNQSEHNTSKRCSARSPQICNYKKKPVQVIPLQVKTLLTTLNIYSLECLPVKITHSVFTRCWTSSIHRVNIINIDWESSFTVLMPCRIKRPCAAPGQEAAGFSFPSIPAPADFTDHFLLSGVPGV